jgi:hypothetical protein
MSHILAALLPLLILGSLHELPDTSLKDIALQLIAEAHASVEVNVEEPDAGLTPGEKRQIGRYLETPSLEEVYPGIGQALARNRR